MRKSRRETIKTTGIFHKVWHAHDREGVLDDAEEKAYYLSALARTYTGDIREHVRWSSYCLMGNHVHEIGALTLDEFEGLEPARSRLSTWMRNGHSIFGQGYNRRHDRRGKVAYDRPHTPEIDCEDAVLTVMFYGDVNPVRKGCVSHPSRWPHSSHRFYAYGEANEYTTHLTPPPAYLALGSTPAERQARYRSLCDEYMRREGLINDRPSEEVEEPRGAEVANEQRPVAAGEAGPATGPPHDDWSDFW
jgi:putative transposase